VRSHSLLNHQKRNNGKGWRLRKQANPFPLFLSSLRREERKRGRCTSSRTCSANGRSRLSLLSLLFSPLASLFSLSFLPPLLSLCLSLSLSLFSHLSLQEGSCGVVLPPFFTTRFRPVHFPHPSYPLRRPPSPSLMVPLHSASSARPRRRRERRRQRPPTPQAPRGT